MWRPGRVTVLGCVDGESWECPGWWVEKTTQTHAGDGAADCDSESDTTPTRDCGLARLAHDHVCLPSHSVYVLIN